MRVPNNKGLATNNNHCEWKQGTKYFLLCFRFQLNCLHLTIFFGFPLYRVMAMPDGSKGYFVSQRKHQWMML